LTDDCEFCRIAHGADPDAYVVCEDSNWVAFLPLEPATPGHTLIVPRQHVHDFWSTTSAMRHELVDAAVQVGGAIAAALDPDGMNLITSAGGAAEQTVGHLHLHVVPRWTNDDFGEIWPPRQVMSDEVKTDLTARIRAACGQRD
jgi:histidine triad (HIT) family protein